MSTTVDRTTAHASAASPGQAPAGTAGAGFRPDIEGLRAVAVLMVLVYHAGVRAVPGGFVGVDVFFVISGFLITGLIVREIRSTGRLSLARFYARRIRRLLPATALVLAVTAVLTIVVIPPLRWESIAFDIAAAAAYVVNWRLATDSVNYLTAENAPSPVQHFWSLAVEEQFYVVWPLLIMALVWWHRRSGWSLGKTLGVGLVVIALPSLVWSIVATAQSPSSAYFVSTTRLWELAVGAALALAAARLTAMPRGVAVVLGWAGIAAIVAAALLYSSATPFPGAAALLPTLGAAAVIAAGLVTAKRGVGRVLGWQPLQDIGALSYSLYLWHWPLLVVATAAWGDLSAVEGILVVGFSAVPAWLSYRVVEYPIHHARGLVKRPGRAFVVGIAATAIGVASAGALAAARPEYRVDPNAPGATVLGEAPTTDPDGQPVDSVDSITPDPLAARDDNPEIYADECHQTQTESDLLSCVYGDEAADKVIALVGDSHAAQWQPALDQIAERGGWQLEVNTKSACGFFAVDVAAPADAEGAYESCRDWNRSLLDHLTGDDRPDIVITSGSNAYDVYSDGEVLTGEENTEAFAAGLKESWQAVVDAGVPIVVIRDTPRLELDMPECVSVNTDTLTECLSDRDEALERSGEAQSLAIDDLGGVEGVDGLTWVDHTDWICPTVCMPVIGNVMVWRDPHHMTATYVRTLTAYMERDLSEVLSGG